MAIQWPWIESGLPQESCTAHGFRPVHVSSAQLVPGCSVWQWHPYGGDRNLISSVLVVFCRRVSSCFSVVPQFVSWFLTPITLLGGRYIYIPSWWFGTMEFYDFPCIGNNHPKWLICFRGVGQPPTRYLLWFINQLIAGGHPLVFVDYRSHVRSAWHVLVCRLHQWPFQDPRLEVPTIYKAYFSGLDFSEYHHKIWPNIWYYKVVPPNL